MPFSIDQVTQAMKPSLEPQLTALEKLPKAVAPTPPSAWKVVNLFNAAIELPNYFENQRRAQAINASYQQLHQRIQDLSAKVENLALPFDVAQRDACRQQLQKEVSVSNEAVLELQRGVSLFAERTENSFQVQQLKHDLDLLSAVIQGTKSKMEAHFEKVVEKQFIYEVLAPQLRDVVRSLDKKMVASLTEADQATLKQAGDILKTSKLSAADFKLLVSTVNTIVSKDGLPNSAMRALFADTRRLDNPEALIAQLAARSKTVELPKEQVQSLVGEQLKKLLEQAFAHKDNDWHFISSPQPLINQRLSAEELAALEQISKADLRKLPTATLLLYTQNAIALVVKGFDGALPTDVSGTKNLLGVALKNLEQPVVEKKLTSEQRQSKGEEVAADFGKVIDAAFACKTASGRVILEAKMLPNERQALRALKDKATSMAKEPAKLKTVVENALDLIDRAFLSEVPPLRTVTKPADLADQMKAMRAKLRLIA